MADIVIAEEPVGRPGRALVLIAREGGEALGLRSDHAARGRHR